MATIRVTPETLEQQGQDLIKKADDIKEILTATEAKINEIIDGWDGLAQDAYYEMYNQMKQSLEQLPELVRTLGTGTEAAAKAFAEMDESLRSSFSGA